MPDIADLQRHARFASPRTSSPLRSPRLDAKLALLASAPAFAGCSRRVLVELGRVVDVIEVDAGVVVQRQGERIDWWSLLLRGTIMATSHGLPEAMLHDGDQLGAWPAGGAAGCTLLTLTPVLLATADRRRLAALVERFPALAQPPGAGAPRKKVSKSPSTPAPCSVMPPSTTMV